MQTDNIFVELVYIFSQVAQAHTNASALRDAIHRNASASANNNNSSSSPSRQPRPPPQSANARKPISAKRLARYVQLVIVNINKTSIKHNTSLSTMPQL